MSVKLKTTFIVLCIFIIGVIVGAMLSRAILQSRVKKFMSMRTPAGFANMFENIINPGPDQRKSIAEILDKYGKKISEDHEKFRDKILSNINSMKAELEPILTPEQVKRLGKRFSKMRRFSGIRKFPSTFSHKDPKE